MRSEFIDFDQTLHGYDKGHRLLASSLRLESQDERALLTMSDLSGPRAAENFLEYLTGYMLPSGSHYALAKTWYATEMERPGCVWTHTFLIEREIIDKLCTLEPLANSFFRPRLGSGYRYAEQVHIPVEEFARPQVGKLESLRMEQVSCAIEWLYKSDDDLIPLVASSGREFEPLTLRLWAQMWPKLRTKFSFCTGSLAKRNLSGNPLVFQCGPDRAIRGMGSRSKDDCTHEPWVAAILADLEENTSLRPFLLTHAKDMSGRSSVSNATKVYVLLQQNLISEAIKLVAHKDFQDEGGGLQAAAMDAAKRSLAPTKFLKEITRPETLKRLRLSPVALHDMVQAALKESPLETVQLVSKVFKGLDVGNRRAVVSGIADSLETESLVSLAEPYPELFSALIEERPDFCYSAALWSSSLALLDKIDLFDVIRERPGVSKQRLFDGIFNSHDPDLFSELIPHLKVGDLGAALEWLEQSDSNSALRPQWLTFVRHFQGDVASWANQRKASKRLVLILANVLDFSAEVDGKLSESTILALASEGHSLIFERHEVAAFIYVTTTSVSNPEAAAYCFDAFAVLHRAVAESRLSNRAWQILRNRLIPLPDEDWNECEKLRRGVLHCASQYNWPTDSLWEIVSKDANLFHDFLRTAKVYREGRNFFFDVRDAAVRREYHLTKQQFKEINKLLR